MLRIAFKKYVVNYYLQIKIYFNLFRFLHILGN